MKKIIAGFAMVLMAFLVSNSAAADPVVGKVVKLNPCVDAGESKGYILVTLDSGDIYRLAATHNSNAHFAALRKTIFSTLLVAYEREYTVSFETGYGTVTRCGVSTPGHIESLALDKDLN